MKKLNYSSFEGSASVQFFEKLIGKKQLAENLNISVSFINKLMKAGKIRYHKVGRRVLFKFSEVAMDLQKRSVTS